MGGQSKKPLKPRAQAPVLALVALAACLSSVAPAFAADDDDAEPGWSDKLSDKFKDMFSGAGKAVGLGRPAAPPERESPSGCPSISVLPGTEVQRVSAPGASGNAGVKYQFSLGTVARDCANAGGRVAIRVGAEGRVLLGPAGAAGTFDIPIRVVIYSELNHKPVESKLFKVPASIPAGVASAPFRFLSDSIAVPGQAARAAIDYTVKVGFDSGAAGATPRAKTGRRHRSKETTESASQQ